MSLQGVATVNSTRQEANRMRVDFVVSLESFRMIKVKCSELLRS